jgi:tetratricopeptide (TPR) repeat protein
MGARARRRSPRALALALAAALAGASGCGSLAARGAFSRGQKAAASGDLARAVAAYERAVAVDPENPRYREALEHARAKAHEERRRAALEAEGRGDLEGAVRGWDEALEVLPTSESSKARRALAIARREARDPAEIFEAARSAAALEPEDAALAGALASARRDALTYHLRVAGLYADGGDWARAHEAFSKVRALDPAHPALASDRFQDLEARSLEAAGDRAAEAGDLIAACAAYERALASKRSAELERKLARAKLRAGPLREHLARAEEAERRGRWEEAAEFYTAARAQKGAPAELAPRAAKARMESARLRAARAEEHARLERVEQARAELLLALEHTDLAPERLPALTALREALQGELPGAAEDRRVELEPEAAQRPAIAAARAVIRAQAHAQYQAALVRADQDPGEAWVKLSRLSRFAEELAGYPATQKKLQKSAFGALLSRAEAESAASAHEAAAEALVAAQRLVQAPAELGQVLAAAAVALERKEPREARLAFAKALELDGRSRLARVGLEVARRARVAELARDAREARLVEDPARAALAYRELLTLEPGHAEAQAGLLELGAALLERSLEAARAHLAAERFGAAYVHLRRALAIDPQHAEAKTAQATVAARLGASLDAPAFVAAIARAPELADACAGVEGTLRDRVLLYLARTPGLGIAFLDKAAAAAVDRRARPQPPIVVATTLKSCEVTPRSGAATLSLEVRLGDASVASRALEARFDPASVPKDELADGLAPERVVVALLGSLARQLALEVKAQAPRLAGWPAIAARSALATQDPELVARAHFALSGSAAPGAVLEELERFLELRVR